MTTDLNTLVTALYVKIDDEIAGTRWLGRPPLLTDSELVCLAVAQALLGCTSEARWLRFARIHLAGMFPYLPQRPGYNKRLRSALPLVKRVIRLLAVDTDFWLDNVWIADSTPVECGRSWPTVKRSPAGRLGRLRLLCLPLAVLLGSAAVSDLHRGWNADHLALADPKLDERDVVAAMLDLEPALVANRPGLLLIADKGFKARWFEADLDQRGLRLLRPSMRNEQPHPPNACSNRSASSSSRSTRPSKANSTWNNTAAGPSRAPPPASPSASWQWPQRSGTTTAPASRSPDH